MEQLLPAKWLHRTPESEHMYMSNKKWMHLKFHNVQLCRLNIILGNRLDDSGGNYYRYTGYKINRRGCTDCGTWMTHDGWQRGRTGQTLSAFLYFNWSFNRNRNTPMLNNTAFQRRRLPFTSKTVSTWRVVKMCSAKYKTQKLFTEKTLASCFALKTVT